MQLDVPKSSGNLPNILGVVTDVVVRRQRNVGGVRPPVVELVLVVEEALVCDEDALLVGEAAGSKMRSETPRAAAAAAPRWETWARRSGAGSSISDGDDGAGTGAGRARAPALPRTVWVARAPPLLGRACRALPCCAFCQPSQFGCVCLLLQSYAITSAVGSDASQPSSMFKMTAD